MPVVRVWPCSILLWLALPHLLQPCIYVILFVHLCVCTVCTVYHFQYSCRSLCNVGDLLAAVFLELRNFTLNARQAEVCMWISNLHLYNCVWLIAYSSTILTYMMLNYSIVVTCGTTVKTLQTSSIYYIGYTYSGCKYIQYIPVQRTLCIPIPHACSQAIPPTSVPLVACPTSHVCSLKCSKQEALCKGDQLKSVNENKKGSAPPPHSSSSKARCKLGKA